MGKFTINGYLIDEVVSALQKDIRRGNTEQACYWAYELLSTNKYTQDKFWERMFVISAEDVGLANVNAVVIINALYQGYKIVDRNRGDAKMLGMLATWFLSKQKKDRTIDDLYLCFKNNLLPKPKIPEYAIDKHTEKGKELGRGFEHFFKVGAKLNNESENYDKRYLKLILKNVKNLKG